jgi:hypothetical protein
VSSEALAHQRPTLLGQLPTGKAPDSSSLTGYCRGLPEGQLSAFCIHGASRHLYPQRHHIGGQPVVDAPPADGLVICAKNVRAPLADGINTGELRAIDAMGPRFPSPEMVTAAAAL